MNMTSFAELVEVMNMKSQYEELITSSKLSIPKKYKYLNMESAHWCVNKLDVFNKKNKAVNDVKALCFDYLERGANIRLVTLIDEYAYT